MVVTKSRYVFPFEMDWTSHYSDVVMVDYVLHDSSILENSVKLMLVTAYLGRLEHSNWIVVPNWESVDNLVILGIEKNDFPIGSP